MDKIDYTHAKSKVYKVPTINSFDGFYSPIDGEYIGSSQRLSAHEKEHDVVQVGDDPERKRKAKLKECELKQ